MHNSTKLLKHSTEGCLLSVEKRYPSAKRPRSRPFSDYEDRIRHGSPWIAMRLQVRRGVVLPWVGNRGNAVILDTPTEARIMQDASKEVIISNLVRGIGVPLKIDNATSSGNFGHFTRVLIDVDLAGFIPETLLLEIEDSCIEVQLYYENYPEFCNNCYSIRHSVGRCNMVHIRIHHVAKSSEKVQGETKQSTQIYRPKPPISTSLTNSIQVPPSTVADIGIAAMDLEADHAAQKNTMGKGVQTVPLDMGVVHHSDTVTALNDTFDDLDDELPSKEGEILQDFSGR
ncbi:hypothetical protein FNV43_RR27012 [Rhamnella rubrinervis]|uniref:Zinc knuckle CX2CX4HX4C domain-containing protein n=1 Tax=Rhamnella rubrinervis TaxID=2594499 RepID=A0A8K0DQE2_9ROSA|nr:hypothetical protein FNV43_RR27012 [Rhamnella rubrinervis]